MKFATLAIVGAGLVTLPARGVVIADLAADYVDDLTLPANYAYLESDAPNGGTELPLFEDTAVGNLGAIGFGSIGFMGINAVADDAGGIFDADNNITTLGVDLTVHPSGDGSVFGLGDDPNTSVIVRRTITAADLTTGTDATIAGSFRNLAGGDGSDELEDAVSVFIYQNNTLLFSVDGADPAGTDGNISQLSQADGTFSILATLAVGDTIDFVVDSNETFFADETAIQATIEIGAVALDPADLDLDGDVDDADFALFFAAFSGPGVPTGNPAADLDGDTDTDDADFGLAFAAFTGPGGAAASVPEPTSLALMGLGGLLIARRRRA